MSMMVSFVLSFFPRDVLDEILNLIESVSEDFPSYSCTKSDLSLLYSKDGNPSFFNLSEYVKFLQHLTSFVALR